MSRDSRRINVAAVLLRRELAPQGLRLCSAVPEDGCGIRALSSCLEADLLRRCAATYCELKPPPRSTIALAFSPDGRLLASTHGDHTVKVINCRTGTCLQSMSGHRRTPWVVRFHPTNSNLVASGSLDFEVRLWDVSTGECINHHNFGRPIASMAFHVDGEVLAVAAGHKLHMWEYSKAADPGSPGPVVALKTRRSLRAVHLHPCGAPLVMTAEVNEPSDLRLLPYTFEDSSRTPFSVARSLGRPGIFSPRVGSPMERTLSSALEEPTAPDAAAMAAVRRQAVATEEAAAESAAERLLLLAGRQRALQATNMQDSQSTPADGRLGSSATGVVDAFQQMQVVSPGLQHAPLDAETRVLQQQLTLPGGHVQRGEQVLHSQAMPLEPTARRLNQERWEDYRRSSRQAPRQDISHPEQPTAQPYHPPHSRRSPPPPPLPLSLPPTPPLSPPAQGTWAALSPGTGIARPLQPQTGGGRAFNCSPEEQGGGWGERSAGCTSGAAGLGCLGRQLSRSCSGEEQQAAEQQQQQRRCSWGPSQVAALGGWPGTSLEQVDAAGQMAAGCSLTASYREQLLRGLQAGPVSRQQREQARPPPGQRTSFRSPASGSQVGFQVSPTTSTSAAAGAGPREAQSAGALTSMSAAVPAAPTARTAAYEGLPFGSPLGVSPSGQGALGAELALQECEAAAVAMAAAQHGAQAMDGSWWQQRQQQSGTAGVTAHRPRPAAQLDGAAAAEQQALQSVSSGQAGPSQLPPRGAWAGQQGARSAPSPGAAAAWAAGSSPSLASQRQAVHHCRRSGAQLGHFAVQEAAGQAGPMPSSPQAPRSMLASLSRTPSQQAPLGSPPGGLNRLPAGQSAQADRSDSDWPALSPRQQVSRGAAAPGAAAAAGLSSFAATQQGAAVEAAMQQAATLPPSMVSMGWEYPAQLLQGANGALPALPSHLQATSPAPNEVAAAVRASAAAANILGQEQPCRVKLRLWRHQVGEPCAPLEAPRLTINDAVLCSEMGVHFSPCGRFMAVCVACQPAPPQLGSPDNQQQQVLYEVRIHSMDARTFGQVLQARQVKAAHCLTSVQFSPTSEHLMLAYGRRHISLLRSLVADGGGASVVPVHTILEVYRVSDMSLVRVLPSAEDEVNAAAFHPQEGGGIGYGTKEGRLRLLRHGSPQPRRCRDSSSAASSSQGQNQGQGVTAGPGGTLGAWNELLEAESSSEAEAIASGWNPPSG